MKKAYLLILFALLLGGCRVNLVIEGEGTVTSTSGNFNCTNNTGDCTEVYTAVTSETLTAEPAPGWTFVKWRGCSYKTILNCGLTLVQQGIGEALPWTVTATFEPISKPVEAATYTYNALGQRKTKTVDGNTTVFVYDLVGSLIAELDETGQALRQHIHINNEPIAQLTTNSADQTIAVQYVHTDHLGTPTLLTNKDGNVVADLEATPFGETYVDYAEVTYSKRFPGQYKDGETGLHYNYFRDYDASLGRYIQSDPIGLQGGINTYAYVGGNPLMYIDPTGEIGLHDAAIAATVDVLLQLAMNGGRIECIKPETVAIAFALGLVNPFSLGSSLAKAEKANRQLIRAYKQKRLRPARRIEQRSDKNRREARNEFLSVAFIEATAEGIGALIPDRCGCE